MATSIEEILAIPDKAKETEYDIISAISKEWWSGYLSLKYIIVGGGNKPKDGHTKRKNILSGRQITNAGEQREQRRSEKRK